MSSLSRSNVFEDGPDRRVLEFSESVSFDKRLYAHDIRGSIAHAQMLADQQILTAEEASAIEAALLEIQSEIQGGTFPLRMSDEDIHMNIERGLIERLGDVGRKLHTGRSRNDQVSTDFRLWLRDEIDAIDQLLHHLQVAFVSRCDADRDQILPAYTHLQRAQPVLAPHYWLAYTEKLQRDRERLRDARRRVNICTLGTAAVAGTTLPVDRHNVAKRLGFEEVARNSLDSSGDRDFVLETAFVLALIAEHLSGWAEEWILWLTVEFGFLKLPEQFCTGSSIMPQKINPDVLELTRGKAGRVLGNLQSLLVLIKGLPLAYNRDLQEDKPAIFDSVDTIKMCLQLAAPLVEQTELNRPAIQARLNDGYLDATTLMEYLIQRGMPQRTAHHLVGAVVRKALDRGVCLADLTLDEFQELDAGLDESVYEVLGPEKAVQAFASYGSTAPQEVERQLQYWKQQLALDQ